MQSVAETAERLAAVEVAAKEAEIKDEEANAIYCVKDEGPEEATNKEVDV